MTILLHACCGPCLLYPLKVLLEDRINLTVYFYNHNIHPYKEFRSRLDALTELCTSRKLELIVDRNYGLKEFLRSVVFREQSRCTVCYHSRLKKTAEFAKENNFEFFSSTLLYSKYQNHKLIQQQCADLSLEFSVPFFYKDFREGWRIGVDESYKIGIYRQKYCGCIYSEQERFDNRLKKKLKKGIIIDV